VSQALTSVNADQPGGRVTISGAERSIRTLGAATSIEALRETLVPLSGGRSVRLGDLGRVEDHWSEPRRLARYNGQEAVTFNFLRSRSASEVKVSEKVRERVAELDEAHPELTIEKVTSSVEYIEESYLASIEALLLGAGLAVIVVFIFLRNWRATFITATAMPLSLIPAFAILGPLDQSLNVVTLLALSLTPALCATLLKPVDPGRHQKGGVFGWFNRRFERFTEGYAGWVGKLVRRTGRTMAVFAAVLALLAVLFVRLPGAFLPDEDQGSFMTMVTLPADATVERTQAVLDSFEAHLKSRPGILDNTSIIGFGFSGSGQNAAMAFTNLVDWKERKGATVQQELEAANGAMANVKDGTVMALNPPTMEDLDSTSGFAMRLQDIRNQGPAALAAAQAKLLKLAAASTKVVGVYADGLPDGASIDLKIDRQKAEAMGVSFEEINNTLSAAMGSSYVNDFPNEGRLQQVIVQADPKARMQIDDVLGLYVRGRAGDMVRLSTFVTPQWAQVSLQMVRYNGYPAVRIAGSAAPGVSSGVAMVEMERLAAQLPPGFSVAWTGQSMEERQSGAQAPMLLALSMLVVFLVLAALYESWSIPLSVMLAVPLGVIGAVAATMLRGLPNDVFFNVGLITIIGLSAKNAILIVEFAKMLREQGQGLLEATITAARLRLRPIIMTSLAFTLGVVPLVVARGASAATQHSIGTGVFGGMIAATFLAIFFVPVFFVFVLTGVEKLADRIRGPRGATASSQEA